MAKQGQARRRRDHYRYFLDIPTRWMDNDIYGHVNNVVYYSYFDTVINRFLIEKGGLDIHGGNVIGVAVETMCQFYASFAYPETVVAGLCVGRLGRSSVRYELGLFAKDCHEPAAEGHFVHVFVDRLTSKPKPIPQQLRQALQQLQNN